MEATLNAINHAGQVALTWCLVAGTLWALLKGTQVGKKLSESQAAQEGERWLNVVTAVAEAAVQATEQHWRGPAPSLNADDPDLVSFEKKQEALGRARSLLPENLRGRVPDVQLESAIEAAVGRMNAAEGTAPR